MAHLLLQRTAPSGSEALSWFLKPAADVAYIGMTPFALALRLGIPVRIVAVAQKLGTSHGIVVRKGKKPSRNSTLILATVAGSTGHQVAADWAVQNRIPVRFLYLSPPQQLLAFRCGYVDGIASWEPFLTQARQLDIGGEAICNATCLSEPIFNIICATTDALERKGVLVKKFLSGLRAVSAGIKCGELVEELNGLPWLFGNDLKTHDYRTIIAGGYSWPSPDISPADRMELQSSWKASDTFLERAGFPKDRKRAGEIFGTPSDHGSDVRELTVAYTDSLMCTAYHLSVIRGDFERAGFELPRSTLSRGQRIALLKDDEARGTIRQLDISADRDPNTTLVACRMASEDLLKQVYCGLTGDSVDAQEDRLEKMIERLNHARFFPDQAVYAAAHNIRVAGNRAAHYGQEGVAMEEVVAKAHDLVDQLLKIFEWRQSKYCEDWLKDHKFCRNPKCEKPLIKRSANFCPTCQTSQAAFCECGHALQPTWQSCPGCGRSMVPGRAKVQAAEGLQRVK